jgi:hypothetical protein
VFLLLEVEKIEESAVECRSDRGRIGRMEGPKMEGNKMGENNTPTRRMTSSSWNVVQLVVDKDGVCFVVRERKGLHAERVQNRPSL